MWQGIWKAAPETSTGTCTHAGIHTHTHTTRTHTFLSLWWKGCEKTFIYLFSKFCLDGVWNVYTSSNLMLELLKIEKHPWDVMSPLLEQHMEIFSGWEGQFYCMRKLAGNLLQFRLHINEFWCNNGKCYCSMWLGFPTNWLSGRLSFWSVMKFLEGCCSDYLA